MKKKRSAGTAPPRSLESRRVRITRDRRQARTGAGLSDQDIEQALRRKAAKGDVAAARELRERARSAPVTDPDSTVTSLEDMSTQELERLRERLLRMAQRMEGRARRA